MEYRSKEKINLPVEESIVISLNKLGENGWKAVNIYGGPTAANIDVVGAANQVLLARSIE
jgi:hypothetical protein